MNDVWDELEWTDALPEGTGDIFPRLEAAPAVGTKCWIRLHGRSDGSAVFQALFQPALSSLNGWTVHPQELLESAVLECRLLEARSGRKQTWLHVEVGRVTPLAELSLPPEPARDGLDGLDELGGLRARACALPLHYFESDFEADDGAWAVCRESAGELSVILSNSWTDGERGLARLGNRLLTPAQREQLMAFPVEAL